jgi:hypothetical protein
MAAILLPVKAGRASANILVISSEDSMGPIYEMGRYRGSKIMGQKPLYKTMDKLSHMRLFLTLIMAFCIPALSSSVTGKDKPPRTLKVKIVADQDFAHQTSWERKAARRIDDIAEEVVGLLQVKIEIVDYELWEHADEPDLYRLTSQMIDEVDPGEAEMLIGFTYVPCPDEVQRRHTDGVTIPYRGMIINIYQDRCWRNTFIPYVMIHEMVHAFGGVHVREKSLMTPVFADTVNLTVDRLNQNILRHTRDIDFREGYRSLSCESLEKLSAYYQLAMTRENISSVSRLELGKMFMAMDDYTSAISALRPIVDNDSTYTDAWILLSICHTELGRPDRAIEQLNGVLAKADRPGLVHYRLMELYLVTGDSANARQEAAQARKHGIAVDSVLLNKLQVSGDDTN